MVKAEGVVLIKRSPEEVWEYLSDLTQVPAYIPGVTRVEVDAGPIGVGTQLTEVRRGGRLRGVLAVVEWDPHNRLRLRSLRGPLHADRLYQLRRVPDGTELRYAMEVRGSGRAKFIELLIRGAVRRDTEAILQALKWRIEFYP